ncbi:MAG: transglycosylase domain-containing protein [Clostridia bacterium]|nr:transglycosylase domain-containing protein [Clostridia bacterium]
MTDKDFNGGFNIEPTPEENQNNEFNDSVNSNEGGTFDLNSFSTISEKAEGDGKKPDGGKGKTPKSRKAKIIQNVLYVALIGIIVVCIGIGVGVVLLFTAVDDDIPYDLNNLADTLDGESIGFSTTIFITDKKTGQYVPYDTLSGMENRIWISFNDMPEDLGDAFVAIEDERFGKHAGVDLKRTFLAVVNMFLHYSDSEFGGSTITQQLVKNLTQDNDHSAMRKIREIMRARKLESEYDKDTILECYLNTIYMGKGAYGVECAANYYFGKKASELTIAECAVLASIAKSPTYYNPVDYFEDNKDRKETVLYKMHELGYITDEEYEEALDQEIVIVASSDSTASNKVNSYFLDALIEQVANDLVEQKNMDKSYAVQSLYDGGYKIYCTMVPEVQEAVEAVYTDETQRLTNKKTGELAQGAITVMDYEGHVVGIAGGLGEKKESRGLNRATSAPRQLGSSMKPLTAYSLSIENGSLTYSSIVDDKKIEYPSGGEMWTPNNWYNDGGYYGKITAAYAVQRSVNTIPVALVNALTPQVCYDFLTQKLGFTHLNYPDDANLSPMGMGGTSGGVTTLEAAAAYAMFGNGGFYYEPTFYTLVTDQQDNIILNRKTTPHAVIGEDTACIMNHMLQNVIYGGDGTGRDVTKYVPDHRIFAKTGTSNNDNDLWFVGGTSHYIAASWYGYDNNGKVQNTKMARNMWGAVMAKVNAALELKPEKFLESSYVECRYYCTETGLLATDACPSTAMGWYKRSYRDTCKTHEGTIRDKVVIEDNTSSTSSGTADGTTSSQTATPSQTATSSAAQ